MPHSEPSVRGMPSEDHMAWLAPVCDCGHFHQDHSRYGCLHCRCSVADEELAERTAAEVR